MKDFRDLVKDELWRARHAHGSMNSLHEGYAVLLEEVDELWDEVKKRSSQRDQKHILEEVVQIAAMAQRIAEDLNLLEG